MRRRVEASELDGALRPGRVEIECVVSRAVEQERPLVISARRRLAFSP